MPELFDLSRFVEAQDPVIGQVLRELEEGRKRSHWMWFIFPQMSGLGHSAMARRYAISSLEEAKAYLRHAILGPRLRRCTELVNKVEGRTIYDIFGSPDDMKFHSCMTLFSAVEDSDPVFRIALDRYFKSVPDRLTTEKLASKGREG